MRFTSFALVLAASKTFSSPVSWKIPTGANKYLKEGTNQCMKPDGTYAPCGPGNDQCGPAYGLNRAQFHIMDKSCEINDPNGPVYDKKHKMYHLFYQDHLAEGDGFGPDYGHAVSRDLVHWAHLPVAIWNDQPYDSLAIFTGSATVVDGQIVQVYPGLCTNKIWPNCTTGTGLNVAVPADLSDPFLTNWSKPSYNPIVNNTQRDPSTAWQTPAGEWRLTTFDTIIYGSMDFKTWYKIGEQSNFAHGECPSFFPLPRTTPGAGKALDGAGTPTHVHKASHGGDWMNVGTYTANGPGEEGTWNATPGVSFDEVRIDQGNFYASKDFFDPVGGRRILWGWATIPSGAQTLPREITWNPELQQLVHSPLPEQIALREDKLTDKTDVSVAAGQVQSLGDWPGSAGNQSEIYAEFQIPTSPGTLGLIVVAGADGGQATGMLFYANFSTQNLEDLANSVVTEVAVGSNDGGIKGMRTYYNSTMPHTDMPAGNYNVSGVNYTDYRDCQAACLNDKQCLSWTYGQPGIHPYIAKCCLKNIVGVMNPKANAQTYSGVRNPGWRPSYTGVFDTLRLSPADKMLGLRVYVDNTLAEAFFQGGRVAMTRELLTPEKEAAASVAASVDVQVSTLQAWTVGSIWVTPEEILNTPPPAGAGSSGQRA